MQVTKRRRSNRRRMYGVLTPDISSAQNQRQNDCKHYQQYGCGNPFRSSGDAVFRSLRGWCQNFAARQIVFGEQIFFAQTQVARDGAHETAAKNAAGKLFPVLVFECFEEFRSDARGGTKFIDGHFPQLAFALQALPKRTLGHFVEPVPRFLPDAEQLPGGIHQQKWEQKRPPCRTIGVARSWCQTAEKRTDVDARKAADCRSAWMA